MKPSSIRFIFSALVLLLLGCDNPDSQAQAKGKAWFGDTPGNAHIDSELTRRNYYIVLDGSGSMREKACGGTESKAATAKQALIQFLQKIPSVDNVGLLVFDNRGISERAPLGIRNRARLRSAIQEAGADSGTPLMTSITAAYNQIKLQAQKQLGYGEYHLVIVTDGEANPGEDPSAIVSTITSESPVVLHTIGFCIGSGHSLNQPGRTIYKEASNLQDLTRGLESVIAESEKFVPFTFKKK